MTSAEERFRDIYSRNEQAVLRYCLRRVDRDAALDCAAETFLTAWRRIDEVPTGDRAIRWLYRTAHHVIGNYYRRRDRDRQHVVSLETGAIVAVDTSDGPETLVVRREADEEVLDALSQLRDIDRQVLLLSAWEELPHDAIAEVVGSTPHAVDQRIHRAIRRLGHELASNRHTRLRRRLLGSAHGEVSDVDAR